MASLVETPSLAKIDSRASKSSSLGRHLDRETTGVAGLLEPGFGVMGAVGVVTDEDVLYEVLTEDGVGQLGAPPIDWGVRTLMLGGRGGIFGSTGLRRCREKQEVNVESYHANSNVKFLKEKLRSSCKNIFGRFFLSLRHRFGRVCAEHSLTAEVQRNTQIPINGDLKSCCVSF